MAGSQANPLSWLMFSIFARVKPPNPNSAPASQAASELSPAERRAKVYMNPAASQTWSNADHINACDGSNQVSGQCSG